MSRTGSESGQAAPELIVVVLLVILLLAVLAQASIAGYALWSAGLAARAGARAAHVGGDGEEAAISALPGWLASRAEIDVGQPLRVVVEAPALIPGLGSIAVRATAALSPEAG